MRHKSIPYLNSFLYFIQFLSPKRKYFHRKAHISEFIIIFAIAFILQEARKGERVGVTFME